jgi:hypothetical protein
MSINSIQLDPNLFLPTIKMAIIIKVNQSAPGMEVKVLYIGKSDAGHLD